MARRFVLIDQTDVLRVYCLEQTGFSDPTFPTNHASSMQSMFLDRLYLTFRRGLFMLLRLQFLDEQPLSNTSKLRCCTSKLEI